MRFDIDDSRRGTRARYLGPVPCIGCPARRAVPLASTGERVNAQSLTIAIFGFPAAATGNQSGLSLDQLLFGTSCHSDIELSHLRALSWQLTLPPFVYASNAALEVDIVDRVTPGESCQPQ